MKRDLGNTVEWDLMSHSTLTSHQGGSRLPQHVETWLQDNIPSTPVVIRCTNGKRDYDRPLTTVTAEQERQHFREMSTAHTPDYPIGHPKLRLSLSRFVREGAYRLAAHLWRAIP